MPLGSSAGAPDERMAHDDDASDGEGKDLYADFSSDSDSSDGDKRDLHDDDASDGQDRDPPDWDYLHRAFDVYCISTHLKSYLALGLDHRWSQAQRQYGRGSAACRRLTQKPLDTTLERSLLLRH
jgi:hypothetical protein